MAGDGGGGGGRGGTQGIIPNRAGEIYIVKTHDHFVTGCWFSLLLFGGMRQACYTSLIRKLITNNYLLHAGLNYQIVIIFLF